MDVLVTGASRGIGRACAVAFAEVGHRVTAVARSEVQLRDLQAAHPTLVPLVADLTRTAVTGTYDVVVLNAGDYAPGGLLDAERDVLSELLPLNVLANHRLGRALLPPMVARGRGHLVVIGSSATDAAPGHMGAYAVTKRWLRVLFEGWAAEVEGTGVRCTLVAPGATLTSSWAGEEPPARILRPEQVAQCVYRAVAEGRTGRLTLQP